VRPPGPARPPQPVVLTGRHVRLEPLAPGHAADLYRASSGPDIAEKFRYLFDLPPTDLGAMQAWIALQAGRTDPMTFAAVEPQSGRCLGRQALMRIVPEHGVIEIGSIYWGPDMARTPRATEALYLFARHVFEDLGYRRFEWKCDSANLPSRRAAQRFGFQFEGVFRQHMIIRGANRDTAWFAMLDGEWPALKAGYEAWLDPANFDAKGVQKRPLEAFLGG